MFALFSRKSHLDKEATVQGSLWALIDIQSGLVRGSLVSFKKGGPGEGSQPSHIIYTVVHQLSHKSELNSAYVLKSMLHGVEEVAQMLSHIGMHRVHESGYGPDVQLQGIHYILSSPWVMSETKNVNVSYERPTVVDAGSVQEIINEARAELEAKSVKFDAVSIEQKIFEVKLNGYSVNEYEGKTADELSVSCAISIASKKVLDRISAAVRKYLHVREEHCHSALLLEYAGLRNILQDRNDYIVIHAHSELTDVVVVKAGMCVFLSSFPFGIYTVIRKIAHASKQSSTASGSLLTLFDGDKLSPEESVRIGSIIADVTKGWVHDLFGTLKHAGDTILIPRNVILSAHSHFGFFAKGLEGQKIVADFKPKITALELSQVSNFVRYERGQEPSLRMGIYATAIATFL